MKNEIQFKDLAKKKESNQTFNQQLETNTISNQICRFILTKVYQINKT